MCLIKCLIKRSDVNIVKFPWQTNCFYKCFKCNTRCHRSVPASFCLLFIWRWTAFVTHIPIIWVIWVILIEYHCMITLQCTCTLLSDVSLCWKVQCSRNFRKQSWGSKCEPVRVLAMYDTHWRLLTPLTSLLPTLMSAIILDFYKFYWPLQANLTTTWPRGPAVCSVTELRSQSIIEKIY